MTPQNSPSPSDRAAGHRKPSSAGERQAAAAKLKQAKPLQAAKKPPASPAPQRNDRPAAPAATELFKPSEPSTVADAMRNRRKSSRKNNLGLWIGGGAVLAVAASLAAAYALFSDSATLPIVPVASQTADEREARQSPAHGDAPKSAAPLEARGASGQPSEHSLAGVELGGNSRPADSEPLPMPEEIREPAAEEEESADSSDLPSVAANDSTAAGDGDGASDGADDGAAKSGLGPLSPAVAASEAAILEIHRSGKLLSPEHYAEVRKVYSDYFELEYQEAIQKVFGEDAELTQWLNDHEAVKQELFLAIQTEFDDIPRVLELFREIYRQFPDAIGAFPDLAIAVAVTWDVEKSVYDYATHQKRTKSLLPGEMIGALETFRFYSSADTVTKAYVQYLPWEFLVHVVNHRTPVDERSWAISKYGSKRSEYGRCYSDVPYDKLMLATQDEQCRLAGMPYTLPNILAYGGVCAMQADYAARAGKSMGVPAEYVAGPAVSGGSHAWVMWVQLHRVPTKNQIAFSLESAGRYHEDKYYMGVLTEPQTGRPITDRELELRLQTVGIGPEAMRHADLIMMFYPLLREKMEMNVDEQLAFLKSVLKLCPPHQPAWGQIAKISRNNKLEPKQLKEMRTQLDLLFTTFAKCPDFTLMVFDDFVAFIDKPSVRDQYYSRLMQLYVKADRPDLACLAALKFADKLVEEERQRDAIDLLASAIKAFPDEGRFVPPMLDKMEGICREVGNLQPLVVQFYQQILPLIPQRRLNSPSQYCAYMYDRGIKFFTEAGQPHLAEALKRELEKLLAGS